MGVLEEELARDIADQRVAIIAGAGVAAASLGRESEAASWIELIRGGVGYALEVNASLPDSWKEYLELDLDFAQENRYMASLTSAADKVTAALGGADGGEFKAWLRRTFEKAKVQDDRVITALASWQCPILTTNYDTSIEDVTGYGATSWRDANEIHRIVRGQSVAVGHLHGVWRDSASIIFGSQSYGAILGAERTQELQRALATAHSLVFVGVGDGIDDPNFGSLREWLQLAQGSHEVRHYRLCVDGDLERLSAEHADERIMPLSFGSDHGSLANYLARFAPACGEIVTVSERAVALTAQEKALDYFNERLAQEAILREHMADDALTVRDIMIPPILLPVTHEQYVSSQELPEKERPHRTAPEDDAHSRLLLVCGDEKSGLSFALHWLTAVCAELNPPIVPVYLDFRSFPSSVSDPIARSLRRELSACGAIPDRAADVPPVALAIDNFRSRPQGIFARSVAELSNINDANIVLGVKRGEEQDVIRELKAAGLDPEVRFIGRLNGDDIQSMAELVAPGRAASLRERTVEILRHEHLPRTPATVSLLISALLTGQTQFATSSQTALLDAYVGLLLGRGNPHEDARFQLDAHDRAAALGGLAEFFVRRESGSATPSEVVARLSEVFNEYSWSDNPEDVEHSFRQVHILVERDGLIGFGRTSYLYLFAAKRAVEKTEFRKFIFAEPLRFREILTHYAALTRNDPEAVAAVNDLLWEPPDDAPAGSRSFLTVIKPESPRLTIDEVVARIDKMGEMSDEIPQTVERPKDDLDGLDESDPDPFPLDRLEDMSLISKAISVLTLVSTVLRDSELVTDQDLKRRTLQRALALWGHLIELVESDQDFRAGNHDIATAVAKTIGVPADKVSAFVEDFENIAPGLMAFGGMSATLSSTKLSRILHESLTDDQFLAHPRGAIAGAMLSVAVQGPKWSRDMRVVQERYWQLPVAQEVLYRLAFAVYMGEFLEAEDESELRSLLTTQAVDERRLAGSERSAARSSLDQSFKKLRLKQSRHQLPRGEGVFDASDEVDSAP